MFDCAVLISLLCLIFSPISVFSKTFVASALTTSVDQFNTSEQSFSALCDDSTSNRKDTLSNLAQEGIWSRIAVDGLRRTSVH